MARIRYTTGRRLRMAGPEGTLHGGTPALCQERAPTKPVLDNKSTTKPVTPASLQHDLVTSIIEAHLDTRLILNEALGRIEAVFMATASKGDLDGIMRHLARLEAEVRGLRADLRANEELVRDLVRERVPLGVGR